MALATLFAATSASAAVEAGSNCPSIDIEASYSWFNIKHGEGAALPVAAPISGVVTKWRVDATTYTGATSELLKVIRPTADTYEFQIVGESHVELIQPEAVNVYDARIPVNAGDFFGVTGFPVNLGCSTSSSDDHLAYIAGNPQVGTTQTFSITSGLQASVTAFVEPDADGDGYGDETQDHCPEDPGLQGACPPPAAVSLAVSSKVRKRSILLRVSSDGEASVDVFGQVGWNFQPKRTTHGRRTRAHASKKKGVKRLIVGLDGPTKRVAPGALTRFNIRLPKPVLLRLSRLSRRQSVRAKITLRATNPAGIQKNTRVRVKLRGWRPSGRR